MPLCLLFLVNIMGNVNSKKPYDEGQSIYCFGNDEAVNEFHSLMESGLGLYGYEAIPADYVQVMYKGPNFYSLPGPFPLSMKSVFAVAKTLTYHDRSVVLGATFLDNIFNKFQVHVCSGYTTKAFSLDIDDVCHRHSIEPPGENGIFDNLDIISSELYDLLLFSVENLKKDASQR